MARRRAPQFSALREPANATSALAPSPGKILYLDAGSGLAGDMLVAALLDLGVPHAVITAGLAGLALEGYTTQVRSVLRSGIAAKHFEVVVSRRQKSRDYADITRLIARAKTLSAGARELALDAFARLADAEARIHGMTVEQVHFHEVGAVDSIVDIVAAAIAFDYLGASVICSPLPMGRGTTRSAHGVIPLPAPATVMCLAHVPTYDAGSDGEFVTPTGACLVASVAKEFGGWPSMLPERTGFGAGTRDFTDRANVLRVVLGTPHASSAASPAASHVVIEANVDDMTAEVAAYALSRVLDAGALDAWSSPIGMKKGRPAWTLHALTTHDKRDAVAKALLSESTSFGVRFHAVQRLERARRMRQVGTPYGTITLKIADADGLPTTVSPEYEDCQRAAREHGVPLRTVYAAALAAHAANAEATDEPKRRRGR